MWVCACEKFIHSQWAGHVTAWRSCFCYGLFAALPLLHISQYITGMKAAGREDGIAPGEEVTMTPDLHMWVSEASFRVTQCPTFEIGCVIFCRVRDTVPSETIPLVVCSAYAESDSCAVLCKYIHHVPCNLQTVLPLNHCVPSFPP